MVLHFGISQDVHNSGGPIGFEIGRFDILGGKGEDHKKCCSDIRTMFLFENISE